MDGFNSSEYKRSRNSYIVQCTVEYFVSLLVTDVFLAKRASFSAVKEMISLFSGMIFTALAGYHKFICVFQKQESTFGVHLRWGEKDISFRTDHFKILFFIQ